MLVLRARVLSARLIVLGAMAVLLCLGALGCRPVSFVQTTEPGWASIEVRDGLSYEDAWNKSQDIVIRKFEMALASRDSGYARTNWLYTWTGQMDPGYRVRLTLKFTPDRKVLDIKSEAEYGGAGWWVSGTDTRLLETLKSDLMGVLGRNTK